MAKLPCVKPDGDCESVYPGCEDYESCKAACEAMGGCPGGESWYDLDCIDVEPDSVWVSCCDPWLEECYDEQLALCMESRPGFHPMCPRGCSALQVEECDEHLSGIHVCCRGHECLETTKAECHRLGGSYKWTLQTCENNPCRVGCFPPEESYWRLGDKQWSLDDCVTAIACITKPPEEHVPDITSRPPLGRYVPITAHEVRALDQSVSDTDPCKLHYGVLAKRDDGRYQLLMCSQTDWTDPNTRSYAPGYLCKATVDDENAVVPLGRYYFRVGVQHRPPREVQYGQSALRCWSYD